MNAMDKVQIGDIYGLMEIQEKNVKNPESKAKYIPKTCLCKCIECGKFYYKRPTDLLKGKSSSCRCQTDKATAQRNKNNSSIHVGNMYGHLQVIEDLGYRLQSRGKKQSWYKCLCHNCGSIIEVNGNNLQSGGTTSCGCINSRGENLIKQILNQNHINFIQEYTFPDLKSDKGYYLRFDFAIFKNNQLNCLIEFDGRQHYSGPEAKWTHSDSLQEIQYRDNLKNNYCKQNNIKLKRIPYFNIQNINITTLLDDTFTI